MSAGIITPNYTNRCGSLTETGSRRDYLTVSSVYTGHGVPRLSAFGFHTPADGTDSGVDAGRPFRSADAVFVNGFYTERRAASAVKAVRNEHDADARYHSPAARADRARRGMIDANRSRAVALYVGSGPGWERATYVYTATIYGREHTWTMDTVSVRFDVLPESWRSTVPARFAPVDTVAYA